MKKRTFARHLVATSLATSVAAFATTAGAANAEAKPGVGTGSVVTSVLDAGLGNLLGLTLLQDIAASTTDPKVGPPSAVSVFDQVKITSILPGLNQVLGQHRVNAPQGPTDVTTSLLNLDSLNLGALIKGTLEPLTLKALSAPSPATASSARITDLGLLGGLANLGVLNSVDSTGSGTAAAEAGRAMSLDALSVLNLGQLLRGLGLDILNLPLSVISGLVTSLGIPLNLQGATSLQALVESLLGSIAALVKTVENNITTPLLSVIDGLGLPIKLQPLVTSLVDPAIATLVSTLTALIKTVLDLLDSTTLLKLNLLDITTVAKATSSVSTSTASATGRLGSLQIGGITLPGIDLAAATALVNGLLAQIEKALSGILAPLGLGDLLSIRLFDRQTGVTEANGVVKAVASITGLVVKLGVPSAGGLAQLAKPSAGLGSIASMARTSSRSSVKVSALSAAPIATTAANPLESLLGTSSILAKGLELRIGTVLSQSVHALPGTPLPPPVVLPTAINAPVPAVAAPVAIPVPIKNLPRTGGEQNTWAIVAMSLGGVALAARRLRRRSHF